MTKSPPRPVGSMNVLSSQRSRENTLLIYLLLTFWVKPQSLAVITEKAGFCTMKKIGSFKEKFFRHYSTNISDLQCIPS
jgi:hypothetical protein